MLTAYVYGSLPMLESYMDDANRLAEVRNNAMQWLDNKRDQGDTIGYLYYLAQKAMADKQLSQADRGELALLEKSFVTTNYAGLLRYVIAVFAQEDAESIAKRRRIAKVPTNEDGRNSYSSFLNQTAGEALLLQAYLQDPASNQDDLATLVL